jgi:hypothetical protein
MDMEGNLDYENLKLSKFGFKMNMSSFTGFLGWSSMVINFMFLLGSLALLGLPTDLVELRKYSPYIVHHLNAAPVYILGVVVLILSVVGFALSFQLRRHNKNRLLSGVTNVLQTINYIECFFAIFGLCLSFGEIIAQIDEMPGLAFIIPIQLLSLVLIILRVYGIRKCRPGFLLPFLILEYLTFGLSALAVLGILTHQAVTERVFMFFLAGVVAVMLEIFIFIQVIGNSLVLHSIYKHNADAAKTLQLQTKSTEESII